MDSLIQERVCDVVASTLGLDPMQVNAESSAQNLAPWTSLAHLRLIANLEHTFGLRFTMEDMTAMTSVQTIETVLIARGVQG